MLEFDFSLSLPGFTGQYRGEIPSRGITLIFGPSGSGKSLFLRSLCALEPSIQGYIRFRQDPIINTAGGISSHSHLGPCSGVLATSQLFAHLSVADNLKLARSQFSTPEPKQLFAALKIEHLLSKKPSTLSSGESQRVLLARALLSRRQLLLLDETLAHQDHALRHQILNHLQRWSEHYQFPILYSSHQADDIGEVAASLALIRDGRFEAIGPSDIISHDLALSFAQSRVAVSFIQARCTQICSPDRLACFEFSGGQLLLPADSGPFKEGEIYPVKLQARDISITLDKPYRSSILNIVDATVVGIQALDDSAYSAVKLMMGEHLIISHITQRSVFVLGLKEGQHVFVQIKAAAINSQPHRGKT